MIGNLIQDLMNETFRNYEFNPNLEVFPTTQDGLLGYTKMMKVMFEEVVNNQ